MSAVTETVPQTQYLTGNFNSQNVKLRLITVEEYDAMNENGVFDEDDGTELLNGVIFEKMTKRTKHSSANDRAGKIFYRISVKM